jgi:hypothetical protein
MEVFHFPCSAPGKRLAEAVLNALMATFPTHRNRGIKEANLAALRLTTMPGVLVATEFLTNRTSSGFWPIRPISSCWPRRSRMGLREAGEEGNAGRDGPQG